jgi:gamma-glutamyltranspeptidase/glutathione hydrolase
MKALIFLFFIISCSNLSTVKLARGEKESDHFASGKEIMITTQGLASTQAGKSIHELGGNIYDVAVAVSFAISVERPQSTGIGGGGFLLHKNKRGILEAIDFRERAPLLSHEKMYLDKKGNEIKGLSRTGMKAVGVPGLVAGLLRVHKSYGSLPLEVVMKPAIELARAGFKIYPGLAKALKYKGETLRKYPANLKVFFKDGVVKKEGDLLVQKDLAKTLEIIAKKGVRGFYRGSVARAIVNQSKKIGGIITKKDLESYTVKFKKPVVGTFRGYKIASMPPPSSGGIHILQILNILEGYDLKGLGVQSPETIHLVSQAMQAAFYDRAMYLGDTDFVKVPVKGLISKKYAQGLREKISLDKFKEIKGEDPGLYESTETTHFSIMDSEGNVVVSTQTINGWFGSSVMVPGTGIILNNEMDDFATKVGNLNLFGAVGGSKNLIKPKKTPLSSMSPTIVFKDEKPILALGSPSGTRILTCVMSTILNYLEHGLTLKEAQEVVRYHHQWRPEYLTIEEPGFNREIMNKLKGFGYKTKIKSLGCKVQAIAREGDKLIGVSDPRGLGKAWGN